MEPGSGQAYPTGGEHRGALERFQYLFVAVLVLAFLVLGWRGRPPVHLAYDELTYVSVSQSLEQGTYREIYAASAPRHVRYPPGYPAWLLVVRKVAGQSHDVVRGVNLVFMAVALVSGYLIVRKVAGLGVALALLFVLAFNPSLLGYSATMFSEPPFLALTGAALAVSALAPPSAKGPAYLAILLAMGAFLTRVVGLTVILALGLWLWHRRRRAELVALSAACLIVVGGWFTYTNRVPAADAGISYGTDLTGGFLVARNPEAPSRLNLEFRKVAGYATDALPSALALPTVPGTRIDNVLWLAVTVVLGGIGLVVLWRGAPATAWYLVLSGALLLAWPWRQDRLLIPLIPFVMAAILAGAGRCTQSWRAASRTAALGALTGLLGLGAVRGALQRDGAAKRCDRSNPYESVDCYDAGSRSLAAASHYLRAHGAEGTVALTVSGAAVNFLSGHLTESPELATRFPPGEAGKELRERGIRYIIFTGSRVQERERLAPALLPSCRDLRLEARFPPAGFMLTPDPPQIPSEDACGPLKAVASPPGHVPRMELETGPP